MAKDYTPMWQHRTHLKGHDGLVDGFDRGLQGHLPISEEQAKGMIILISLFLNPRLRIEEIFEAKKSG